MIELLLHYRFFCFKLQPNLGVYTQRRTSMSGRLLSAMFAGSFGLLIIAAPLLAHHSFAAEFDGKKPVKVTGIVKKVEWTNPHIWFYVDGKDEVSGRAGVWGFS